VLSHASNAGRMPISRILIATGLFHVGAEIFRLIQTCLSRDHPTKRISWTNTLALARRWLPPARMLHPFPDARFTATIQDKNRMRSPGSLPGYCASDIPTAILVP